MPKLLERRIRPGSDPGEPVMLQEWRPCKCQHCEMGEHWFDLREMDLQVAQEIVDSHNSILTRL